MKHKEDEIQKEIQIELESKGFVTEDLTQEEMAELRKEVEAKLDGALILDGVLFYKDRYSPERFFRHNKNKNKSDNLDR